MLIIVKRTISIIIGIVLALFIYDLGDPSPFEATMLISMLVFLVAWNIMKSKFVHLLHIIPVLCLAIPFIGISTRYEKEFKNYFDNYLGYYISANDPNDIHIVRLSLDGYLVLQPMAIVDNELVEDGRKIVLNRHYTSDPKHIRFDTAWHSKNNTYVTLYKNSKNVDIEYHTETEQRFRLGSDASAFADSFTKNTTDILKIYNSVLSLQARESHTGTFVLYDYEVIDVYNMVNPITDIMSEKIIVEMNKEGFLIANLPNVTEKTFLKTGWFRVRDNSQRIYSRIGCGFAGFTSEEIYEFIDENTIRHEFFWVSFPSWHSSDSIWLYHPDYHDRLHYRILFKREGSVE